MAVCCHAVSLRNVLIIMSDVRWFPMRVTYNRELKVKDALDSLHVESFIPMQYKILDTPQGRRRQLVPAIHNLIFVHSEQRILSELKMSRKELEPLRYMHRVVTETGRSEILYVPDKEMENFLKVAQKEDDSIRFLDYDLLMGRQGKPVRVIEGPFAGVEGTIVRIQRNKRVVVKIEGVAAVAITFVPPSFLEKI